MKSGKYVFVMVILWLFAAPAYADHQHEEKRARDIAVLSEKKVFEWRRIYAERDAAGLDEFLVDSFVVLESDGTVRTKKDEIRWLEETPPDTKPSDFIYTIKQIVFAGNDTAIVYGHGDSTQTTDDNKYCHHRYWSSNTLVRVKGEWKAAFSHVSGSKCTLIE